MSCIGEVEASLLSFDELPIICGIGSLEVYFLIPFESEGFRHNTLFLCEFPGLRSNINDYLYHRGAEGIILVACEA